MSIDIESEQTKNNRNPNLFCRFLLRQRGSGGGGRALLLLFLLDLLETVAQPRRQLFCDAAATASATIERARGGLCRSFLVEYVAKS